MVELVATVVAVVDDEPGTSPPCAREFPDAHDERAIASTIRHTMRSARTEKALTTEIMATARPRVT